jgi:hypothetical protein
MVTNIAETQKTRQASIVDVAGHLPLYESLIFVNVG